MFRTSKSSKPSSSRAALMSNFMYSGMYGSVLKKKKRKTRTTRQETGSEKLGLDVFFRVTNRVEIANERPCENGRCNSQFTLHTHTHILGCYQHKPISGETKYRTIGDTPSRKKKKNIFLDFELCTFECRFTEGKKNEPITSKLNSTSTPTAHRRQMGHTHTSIIPACTQRQRKGSPARWPSYSCPSPKS